MGCLKPGLLGNLNLPECLLGRVAESGTGFQARFWTDIDDYIEENGIFRYLRIYPNPATGTVNIEFANEQELTIRVNIYNALGKKLISKDLYNVRGKSHHSFDINQIPEGIYYLQLVTNKGTVTRKLVVR